MYRALIIGAALLTGCAQLEPVAPVGKAKLRLSAAADGAIEVLVDGAPASPRALELELSVDSAAVVLLEAAEGPATLPLDTVRLRMAGTNRAILFAGDKRGIRLPRSGVVARFRARHTAGGAAGGKLEITRAVLANTAGEAIEVETGGPLALP